MTARSEERAIHRDSGLTLIEVMVALLIFAILSTGVIAAMTTIARMTADNRARVTASNLATREIDQVRALADPFKVVAATTAQQRAGYDYPVDGRVFTIRRSLSWVSEAGGDVTCNSSTNLFYLRINVRVTWPDMITTAAPVQDDTLMAPAARLSDSSTGAIGVSVLGASNDPQSGVQVRVNKNTGGKDLAKQPADTDAEGCTYASQVSPGNYDVVISKTGWIASDQGDTASVPVAVEAGGTMSPQLPLYAKAASIKTLYVPGPVKPAGNAALPSNLDTTYTVTDGTSWTTTTPLTTTTNTTPATGLPRFPYATPGYGVFAGPTKGSGTSRALCPSTDPNAWSAGTSNGKALAGGVRATFAAAPGETKTVEIPVGYVRVAAPTGKYLYATQTSPTGAGNPGCAVTGSVYGFAPQTTTTPSVIALPYGSWRIYYASSSSTPTGATAVAANALAVLTNADGAGVSADGAVTLDPRPLR